jgi:DNA anti-recombination protein RmuC
MTEERDKEAINKLLDIISKQSSLLGLGGDKSDDAVELKKEWFKQVYSGIEKTNQSLEKAQAAISELQSDLHAHEQTSYERLVSAKESFNKELREVRQQYAQDLEKLHNRIEASIQKMNDRLEKLPADIAGVREELRKELNSISNVVSATIDSLKEKELKPINDRVTSIYIKVAVISTVAGIIASAALTIILTFMKS